MSQYSIASRNGNIVEFVKKFGCHFQIEVVRLGYSSISWCVLTGDNLDSEDHFCLTGLHRCDLSSAHNNFPYPKQKKNNGSFYQTQFKRIVCVYVHVCACDFSSFFFCVRTERYRTHLLHINMLKMSFKDSTKLATRKCSYSS